MNETFQGSRTQLTSLVAWCLVFGLIALAIIIGNSMAIVVLTRKKLLRKRTNYFLISLAVADMTVGIFSVPSFIYQLVCFWQERLFAPSIILNIVKTVDVLCGLASTFTLTIIALERVYAICLPLRHRTSTRRLYDISISSVWILAGLLSSLYFFHVYRLIQHKIFFWFLILTFFSSMLVMLLAYLAIWIKASGPIVSAREASLEYSDSSSDKQRTSFTSQYGKERSRRAAENDRKLAVTVFIVTTVFILTWLPFHIINLIVFLECKAFPCSAQPSTDVIYFCKLLHYSNSLLNPVIYSLRLKNFRSTLRVIISSKI